MQDFPFYYQEIFCNWYKHLSSPIYNIQYNSRDSNSVNTSFLKSKISKIRDTEEKISES